MAKKPRKPRSAERQRRCPQNGGGGLNLRGQDAQTLRKSIATMNQRARVHLQIFDGDVGTEFRKQLVLWANGGSKPARATGTASGTPFTTNKEWRRGRRGRTRQQDRRRSQRCWHPRQNDKVLGVAVRLRLRTSTARTSR